MVAASNLRLQQSGCTHLTRNVFLFSIIPNFDGIKSVLQFQFSLTFLQNANFPCRPCPAEIFEVAEKQDKLSFVRSLLKFYFSL